MQDDARCSLCCPSPRSWWVPGCGQKRKSGSIQAVPQLQSAHEMGCTTPQLPCFWCLAGRRHWFRRARSWLLPRVPPAAGRRRWSISTTPLGKIVLRCARGNLLARCAVPRFCFYFTCIVAVASSLPNVATPPEQRRSTAVLPNLTNQTSPEHDWRSIVRTPDTQTDQLNGRHTTLSAARVSQPAILLPNSAAALPRKFLVRTHHVPLVSATSRPALRIFTRAPILANPIAGSAHRAIIRESKFLAP
jgi:hypothetical protein